MALLMDHQFKELPADRQVDTKAFLDSVSYLPSFFDCLGSKVFAPIKADIAGNVTVRVATDATKTWQTRYFGSTNAQDLLPVLKKIQTVYDTDPAQFATLQQILEVEKELHRSEWPKVGATLALMWLKRGLRFIQIMLQSLVDGEKDEKNPNLIRANATKAYEGALKRYHGWFVQNMFKAALYAAPYKTDFFKALSKGQEVKEEDCLEQIRQFLVNFTPTVDAIYNMFNTTNAELDYTV